MNETRVWNKSNIIGFTIREMKGLLDETEISYAGFGRTRKPYEVAVIKYCNGSNANNQNKNRKQKKKNRTKQKKPEARALHIEDSVGLEKEKERVVAFKKKSKRGKSDKNENDDSTDDEEEVVDIFDENMCADIKHQIDAFNDMCVHEKCVFTKKDIMELGRCGIMAHQLTQLLINDLSLLINLTNSSIPIHKLIELQQFTKTGATITATDVMDEEEKERKPFKINFNSEQPHYDQFLSLYKDRSKYIFPKIGGKIYYRKRYNIVLELICMINKYEEKYKLNNKNNKRKITQKECYSGASSTYHWRKPHFILILLDINAWETAVEDEKQWAKQVEKISDKSIEIARELSDIQKTDYKFTLSSNFMGSYNKLCGNIWRQIEKAESSTADAMQVDTDNGNDT